jgi:hypothetical protein
MVMMKVKELPLNCAARNSVWTYPRTVAPRFPGAPVIFELTRSYERPDIFSLPEGADVTVEVYGGTCTLWLDGERRRVHVRQFDFIPFSTAEEARHAFMRLWREVELLESPAAITQAATRWLKASS